MDITLKVLTFILLMVVLVCGQSWETAFQQGNQYYQQGDYEKAAEEYQKIIIQGYESGELYFNLGNAFFKMNKLGQARLYYERAHNLIEGDEALAENIKLLRMRLIDQIDTPPRFFLTAWWNSIPNLLNIDLLVWIEVGLFWLLLSILGIRQYYQSRGKGKRLNILFNLTVILFVVVTVICIQKIYSLETERHAIIMKSSVTLLAEPKLGGTEVFVLHEGTKVKIERENQNWFEIRLEDGKTGWLEQDKLEII